VKFYLLPPKLVISYSIMIVFFQIRINTVQYEVFKLIDSFHFFYFDTGILKQLII